MEDSGYGVGSYVATIIVVSDGGSMSMVAVVSSSPTCSCDYLGLFVVMKSELRARGPCGGDDRRQVVLRGVNLAYFSFGILHQSWSYFALRAGG